MKIRERIIDLCYFSTALFVLLVGPILIILAGYDLNGSGKMLATAPLFISVTLVSGRLLYKKRQNGIKDNISVILVTLAVFILIVVYWPIRNTYDEADFVAYQFAAYELRNSVDNIYTRGYLYPPLLAQMVGIAYKLLNIASTTLGRGEITEHIGWSVVYTWYGILQIFAIGSIFVLSYMFAKKIGISKNTAVILSVLIAFTVPIRIAVGLNQIGVILLLVTLVAFVSSDRSWWLAGIAVAIGVHLKLYPIVIGAAWILTRRWRELGTAAVITLMIAFVSASFGQNWRIWYQFIERLISMQGAWAWHDIGIGNILVSGASLFSDNVQISDISISIATIIGKIGFSTWIVYRIWIREKLTKVSNKTFNTDRFRFIGHATDLLALTLLISPLVWDHHYSIAIPLGISLIATRLNNRPYLTISVLVIVFILPTYPFPLLVLRPAGLIAMLIMTNPSVIAKRCPHPTLDSN